MIMLGYITLFGFYTAILGSSEFEFDFGTKHGIAVVTQVLSKNNQHLKNEMPETLDIKLDLLSDEDGPHAMRLELNKDDLESKAVYVVRENSDGQKTILKEDIAIEQNVGLYQCPDSLASFTVTCEGLEYGMCKPYILGSINLNGTDFDIKPNHDMANTGFNRNYIYNVYNRKQVEVDGKTCTAGEDQEIAAVTTAFQNEETQTEFEHFAMRKRFRVINNSVGSSFFGHQNIGMGHHEQMSGSSNTYAVGLLILVDDVIYRRFYTMSKGYTHSQKETDAKALIRQYYAHVVNAMDIRYRNIRHPVYEIRIIVSGYLIDDNQNVNIWNDPAKAAVEDAMYRAIEWRKMMISELPPHDHLMIFTGRDLYTKISRDYSVTGFASLDSVCRQDSVSIIEDRGGFDCIITATHELGHSLGARHDGDRNICTPQNKFIMTSIGGGDVTKQTVLNPFRFSECSKSYFLDRLQTLSNQGHNCLSVRKSYYDPREFAGLTSVATGQLFSPNKQCQMKLGDDSFYGWGGNLGSFKDVCTHMACKSNKSSTSYNLYNAARGTSCGNKKWCINGECTYDQKAPAKDDACIHGDSLRSFAAYYSCANMISSDPTKCTDRYYRQFCCESCKQYGLNTFTLPGVNTRRTAPNVMSIPVTQHMQRVLPNTFSVRGRQDGFGSPRGSSHHMFSASPVNRNFNSVNRIPRNRGNTNDNFRIFSRHNNMHSGISGQTSNHHSSPQHHQQQYDQNHFQSDSNRYGLKTDSNQFGLRTDSNQFALRTDSNQVGLQTDSNKFGHQSDSNKFGMQTSRTDPSISLPDHQRLGAMQSSFSSMNPGDLSSFRNLIMRTLHLLARTDGSQYNQYNQVPSHNHDNSYMQGTHHEHLNPSNGFFNMREVPRVVVEEVAINTNDSISIETNSTSNMTVSSNTTVETEPLSFSKSQLEEELRNFNLNIALPETEAKSISKRILNTKSHKDKTLSNSLLDNIIDPFLK